MSRLQSLRRLSLMLVACALVAGLALAPAGPTRAADEWCWNDPTLVINGKTVHIDIGAPVSMKDLIFNSSITVIVPANVTASLSGTNAVNFPTTVTLVQSGTWAGTGPVSVTATAVVDVSSSVAAGLKAWQSDIGTVTQTSGVGGVAMTLTFGVQ
jgi:hypothetical protein